MYETWPTGDEMLDLYKRIPEEMRPSMLPLAVILQGFLSDEECDAIQLMGTMIKPHLFSGCEATTRDLPKRASYLKEAVEVAEAINSNVWDYDLDPNPSAWLQTYEDGDAYALHTDTSPGQMRKLTAVVQLSHPGAYIGGKLRIHSWPHMLQVPITRGTIVIFQPWLAHEVTEVDHGVRQSVNIGFYGPPFR